MMNRLLSSRRWGMLSSPMARREALTFYVLAAPWILGFILFLAYPLLRSLYLAFTNYDLLNPPPVWTGLNNLERILQDNDFWQSLRVTVLYTLGSVPGGTVIAIAVGMVLSQSLRGVNWWRTIYFMPSVLSTVAVAILWAYVFHPEIGLINSALKLIGIQGPGWISDEYWALPSLILVSWWNLGGQIVIYLAGLKNIPRELYEAAEVDGAGAWARFWNVTLPMLSPTILFNVVLGTIGALQTFDNALVMTKGGPNKATWFYNLNLYTEGILKGRMGYASALAWIMFVIIMGITLLILRSSTRWVYYESEARK